MLKMSVAKAEGIANAREPNPSECEDIATQADN
jgi:hypothetical protein